MVQALCRGLPIMYRCPVREVRYGPAVPAPPPPAPAAGPDGATAAVAAAASTAGGGAPAAAAGAGAALPEAAAVTVVTEGGVELRASAVVVTVPLGVLKVPGRGEGGQACVRAACEPRVELVLRSA